MTRGDIMKKKKRLETSKKLALFVCILFAISIIFSMATYIYMLVCDKECDTTMLVTLITASAAAFSVTEAAYSNKSRYENVNKIQQSNLKAKYLLLRDIGAMDEETVKLEIEKVFEEIEDTAETEKSSANQEITYNG